MSRARFSVVTAGQIDHGKSTLLGRLLADGGGLARGREEALRALCASQGRPFEYAFFLDALRAEQENGMTVDAARAHLRGGARDYLLIDAPGHLEFLRGMVTGAAGADAALLVVDACEGVRDNTRRHAALLALLGVRRLVVAVNKMDAVGWDEAVFARVGAQASDLAADNGLEAFSIVPVSGREGDNVVRRSSGWYAGPTIWEALENLPAADRSGPRASRMFVQGTHRGFVLGTPESGRFRAGDIVKAEPSGRTGILESIAGFPEAPAGPASAGKFTALRLRGFTPDRGELLFLAGEDAPQVSRRLRVILFWLGSEALAAGSVYGFRLGTAQRSLSLLRIRSLRSVETLAAADARFEIPSNSVADCEIELDAEIAFDGHETLVETGRFAVLSGDRIMGGGLIRSAA